MRKLIIIPAWNEARSIADVVARCRREAGGFDVLVIDDGSGDATASLAASAGAAVVSHPFNIRYGAALQTGYLYALRHGYDLVVQIDADGQHDPADASVLAAPILAGTADLVVGSRFHAASTYEMPPLRRLGSAWFRTLVRTLVGLELSDPTSGLQALSRGVLELYATDSFPLDYPDADVLVLAARSGFRIVDVPANMRSAAGSPSMHAGIGVLYYVYKMTLSVVMNAIRPVTVRRRDTRDAAGRAEAA
ncbi:MAG TPA: glycosyltransferase family 2 protein [Candidatus Binatia bacterium]|jgi:glycosyltransferase involved in cell wall biosynthesis